MHLTHRRRQFLLRLAGSPGSHAGAVAALCATLMAAGSSLGLLVEIAAAITLARLLAFVHPHPRPVLDAPPVRKYAGAALAAEARFAVLVLAAAYLLDWPLPRLAVPVFLGLNFVTQLGLLVGARLILRRLARSPLPDRLRRARNRLLVVGTGARAQALADMILNAPELDAAIDGFLDYRRTGFWRYRDIPLLGHPDLLTPLAARVQVDAVILAVEPEDLSRTAPLLTAAEQLGVAVALLPDVYPTTIARMVPATLNGSPAVVWRRVPESPAALFVKNALDRLGGLVGLILTLPLMLVTALAIKLESPGPVFFAQRRAGANGRPFSLYKFRTMRADAEKHKESLRGLNEMSGPVFKIRNDPRLTRVGRFLRRFSIDEIPQFYNVLRGDMSLVGPRPPLPSEVARFEPWQRRKLSVKPGLTCIWQVSGRNKIDFEDWMKLDLQYIDNWSLWLDAKILARTVPTVLKGDGAV
ncbi:MAG TPA: sugar transferase [candidate division Zixibacteria bacterium]|nr:sugar transferase [candidate division Zixibacteria bacterium]MDD4917446.1 sugar transferase [candidate division Zixibacteria bacterium]MDM7973004.1 sugar transferase [candidate division Zixibacteria bacterium]HOD67319.1 sugar transferase [candidate division Zixibacteria bacterium]HOZ06853.1 sugar transferase [candidate division Zixibacteria bacterium]